MRLDNLQSGKSAKVGLQGDVVTPATAPKSGSTQAPTASGYDGATGRALPVAARAAGQLHSPQALAQASAKQLAEQVATAKTPDEKLSAIKQLGQLADSHPTEVREALRYDVGPSKHTLKEYEVELAKSLGSEGAKLYMDHLYAMADKLKAAGTPKVFLINATFQGGGVAEMFQTQGQILQQLGIEIEWQKTWDHDGAYGEIGRKAFDAFQGGGTVITDAEHAQWAEHNKLLARVYQGAFADPKVGAIFLEDHHAVHFIPDIKKADPDKRIVWRSHVDMAGVLEGKEAGKNLWQKTILPNIKQLGSNDAVFFQPGSVPNRKGLTCNVFVCPPGIDPLAPKNQRLSAERARDILKKEVPAIDFDLKYLVTGGRFVAFKGNVLVQRAFLSVAKDYPEIGLFTFAGIGSGDGRKVREAALYDAGLKEFPDAAKRCLRMDDRSSEQIGAAYNLAGQSQLPYVAASVREGYGMVGDEAGRQGAVPMTTKQGGFSRYGEEPETDAFSVAIADIASHIADPTAMYDLVDGKVVPSPEAKAIEERIGAKLREIFEASRNDPEYATRYKKAAEIAERITLEHSSPVMARNYLAVVAATPTQLEMADERVKAQGAAHVACVADVIGEHMYGKSGA